MECVFSMPENHHCNVENMDYTASH